MALVSRLRPYLSMRSASFGRTSVMNDNDALAGEDGLPLHIVARDLRCQERHLAERPLALVYLHDPGLAANRLSGDDRARVSVFLLAMQHMAHVDLDRQRHAKRCGEGGRGDDTSIATGFRMIFV